MKDSGQHKWTRSFIVLLIIAALVGVGFYHSNEYSDSAVHAGRRLGNRLEILRNRRNLIKVKSANVPLSGFGLTFVRFFVKGISESGV